jgi:hypothetical protein
MSASAEVTDRELCGHWMPRKETTCARRPGHRGECRTAAALEERRQRKTARRLGQTLVTAADRARWNKTYRLARSGLTVERFEQLLEAQGLACAICHEAFEDDQPICIDHDHACCPDEKSSCGECVRGLLCLSCNTALGIIERKLQQARAYLGSPWPARPDARQSTPQFW